MKKTVSLRVIVILISLFMGLWIVSAQSIIERDNNTEQQFDVVDENATFPGGTLAALAFLHANVIYPQKAVKKKIEGRVIVKIRAAKSPNVAVWPFFIGTMFDNKGQNENAIEYYQKANDINEIAKLHNNISACYETKCIWKTWQD